MKFASLKKGGNDGTLVVVNKTMSHFLAVPEIATTLQQLIEDWDRLAPKCEEIYQKINAGQSNECRELNIADLSAPLKRAYQWLDASAYLSHVERVRKARAAQMPESFLVDPLMYQGGSDVFLGPRDNIVAEQESWGIDFEAEIAVVTDTVPQATKAETAGKHIKLIMLVNDISLRNLIPTELAKGFGFLHAKPPTAFSPVAITPDELGLAWQKNKVHLALRTYLNDQLFGQPNAGDDMQFNFADLIAHAAKTRPLSAGTIIGSGTVSNQDISTGCSCLAEKRVLEIIDDGEAKTSFLSFGDRVKIEMMDLQGENVFGSIEQEVLQWKN